ncbi:MAG: DNA-binding protein [Lachnospiraceae bacterium]|nr:DNA-binding protein [Lachnospiraceae bacterium]
MDKILEESLLFDFYSELLTPRQRSVYAGVRFGDLSLSEAAEEFGVSRQGIHDLLRRVEKQMQKYEDSLGLVALFEKTRHISSEIRTLCGQLSAENLEETREKILALTAEWETSV